MPAVAKRKGRRKAGAVARRAGLSSAHARFVREYLIDLNGKAAYQRTYPSCKSDAAARAKAWQLLQREDVRAELAKLEEQQWRELEISERRVLRELAAIGFSNVADVLDVRQAGAGYTEDDEFVPPGPRVSMPTDLRDLPRHVQAAVKKVAETKEGFRLEMHDKLTALEKLGKRLKLWQDDESEQRHVHFVVHVPPPRTREEWEAQYAEQHRAKGREIASLPPGNGNGAGK